MKKTLLTLASVAALTGCATDRDYQAYAETQQRIAHTQAQAHAAAETARYAVLAEIARNGDPTSRVAAAMSLSLGTSVRPNLPAPTIAPPESLGDKALRWAGVLLPSVTQLYGINANKQIATTQSNNQAAVAMNTNNTFAAMNANLGTTSSAIAGAGLNAATTISNNGLSTAGTIAGAGLAAATTISNNGLSAAGTIAGAGLSTATTISNNGLTAANNGLAAATTINAANNDVLLEVVRQLPTLRPNCGTNTSGGTVNCP